MSDGFTYDRLVGLLNYLVANALLLAGSIALGAVVFYGFQMAWSKGDPKKFTEAKDHLLKAALGMALIFGVYTVILTVQGAADVLTN